MRSYQAVFIIKPGVAEDKITAIIDKVKEVIGGSGGEVGQVNPWGRKQLATAFDNFREGHYVVVDFTGEGRTVDALQHTFRVNEDILRFLVTLVPAEGFGQQLPEPAERKGPLRSRGPRPEKA